MAKARLFLLLSIVFAFASCDISISPEVITTPAISTSSQMPVTSTPAPNTTIAPTTKTTTTPTTTTPTTTTTTPTTTTPTTTTPTTTKPTTTTTTTTTTTPAPKTTTPPTTTAPITTPKPKPGPEPQTGTWQVNIPSTNRTCILLQLAASIDISYNYTSNSMEEAVLVLPKDANATGVCSDNAQNVTLMWNQDVNSTNFITFTFSKNGSTFDLESVELNLTMDKVNFPNVNKTNMILVNEHKEFATSVGHSYKCVKSQSLNLTEPSSNVTIGSIKISHVQIEAFMNKTGNTFGEANDCEGSETPDIVPIAVGCALAGLILIVLVAYLIGRRRNQARGYLSMFTENKNEADYIPMKNLSCFQ